MRSKDKRGKMILKKRRRLMDIMMRNKSVTILIDWEVSWVYMAMMPLVPFHSLLIIFVLNLCLSFTKNPSTSSYLLLSSYFKTNPNQKLLQKNHSFPVIKARNSSSLTLPSWSKSANSNILCNSSSLTSTSSSLTALLKFFTVINPHLSSSNIENSCNMS